MTAEQSGTVSEGTSLAEGTAASLSVEPLGRVGDYELLQEIARGGMGVVYKARQLSIGRIVALKMILAGQFVDQKVIKRFRGEVTSAAMLQHANIVSVHEVGTHAGQPFFSMDYVEGQNLAELVGNRPLPAKKAARYLKLLADAIEYAHSQGILHRDLKPSNVLVDSATDQPRLTDFGLAKRLGSDSTLTLTGQVLGSPNFMPPEQASPGHGKVGRLSDVYGLGAVLYYLLTARAPFQAESLPALVTEVANTEPVPLRILNPSVPPDLETICLKCLEKEQNRRYGTAKKLAEDLDRFLADEPVLARPIGPTGKAWRWCKRRPALATLFALVLVLSLVVLVGAPIAMLRIDGARAEAERDSYAADMRSASEALREGAIARVKELLDRHRPTKGATDLRGLEWHCLWHETDQSDLVIHDFKGLGSSTLFDKPVLCIAGGTLYNKGDGPNLRAWDLATWNPIPIKPPALKASGRWLLYPYLFQQMALAVNDKERTVAIYRLPRFEELAVVPVPGQPEQIALNQDIRNLAVYVRDGQTSQVLVCGPISGPWREVFVRERRKVTQLKFSPDGTALFVGWDDGGIGLWSVSKNEPLPSPDWNTPETIPQDLLVPFFDPISTRLFFTRSSDINALQIWDWTTAQLASLRGPDGPGESAFSPDGKLLAVNWDYTSVSLFDAKELRQVGTLRGHRAPVSGIAFSPSRKLIATTSMDHTTRLWEIETGRELQTLGGNEHKVDGALFTPDVKALVTITGEGTIRVWDLARVLQRGVVFEQHDTAGSSFIPVCSPDMRTLAVFDTTGQIHLKELKTGNELKTFSIAEPGAQDDCDIAFSPDQNILAWTDKNAFGVIDYTTGEMKTQPKEGNSKSGLVRFSPKGGLVAFTTQTNLMFYDVPIQRTRRFVSCDQELYDLAFSPDASLLAGALDGGWVAVWNLATGHEVGRVLAHPPGALAVAFSPDGRYLATGGSDATAKIWDLAAGGLKLGRTLRAHVGWVAALCFSPDGRRLISGGTDCSLKIWDCEAGVELGSLYGHRGLVHSIWFSKDGNTIYSTAFDLQVRSWPAAIVH